jgi:HNH endonuclease
MPRGRASTDGDTRVSPNGYHYTRVNGAWRLTHHLVAEKMLGRPIDTGTEMVRFKTGNKLNLDPSNIEVIPKNKTTVRKKLAGVEARIAELEAQREDLLEELKSVR